MMKEQREIIKPIEFDKKEVAILILEQFENVLDRNNISIPDNDREGGEDEARIYGETYYQLEDTIVDILTEHVENRILAPLYQNNQILLDEFKKLNKAIKDIHNILEKRNDI